MSEFHNPRSEECLLLFGPVSFPWRILWPKSLLITVLDIYNYYPHRLRYLSSDRRTSAEAVDPCTMLGSCSTFRPRALPLHRSDLPKSIRTFAEMAYFVVLFSFPIHCCRRYSILVFIGMQYILKSTGRFVRLYWWRRSRSRFWIPTHSDGVEFRFTFLRQNTTSQETALRDDPVR